LRLSRYRGAAALVVGFGLALLASCSWIPFVGKKSDKPVTPNCPIAVILHPLANTAVFNKAETTDLKPLDVTWYGIFSDISTNCTVTGDTLHASLDNVIVAERGPATRGGDVVDFNYFVALTGSDQTILGKKSFAVRVSVPPAAKRGGVNDHVEVAFSTGGRPLSDLNITVGFQESPQAIEFYKNFRGR
jgi:hypothetical protein